MFVGLLTKYEPLQGSVQVSVTVPDIDVSPARAVPVPVIEHVRAVGNEPGGKLISSVSD